MQWTIAALNSLEMVSGAWCFLRISDEENMVWADGSASGSIIWNGSLASANGSQPGASPSRIC